MSVHGEFQRLLDDCVAFLETSSATDAAGWGERLERAAALLDDSLSAAATAALEVVGERGPESPQFEALDEGLEFDRLLEHFKAICRLILGHPANSKRGQAT